MDLFRTLMRTRRVPMSADHVGALNLIEIEFASEPDVLAAWKLLYQTTLTGPKVMMAISTRFDAIASAASSFWNCFNPALS